MIKEGYYLGRVCKLHPELKGLRMRCRHCPECEKERSKQRRENASYNAEQVKRKRKWRKDNRKKYLETSRKYDRLQLKSNLQRRISKNLRHRIYKATIGKTRGFSAVEYLGIEIDDFKKYLESKFQDGMSWDNYGDWHMDHIKPLIDFDLTNNEEAKKACHYTNIQPLWAIDNQRKWIH